MTKARTLANLGAVTSSATELNYVDGVTSAVQTQLDAKLALAGGTMTGDLVPSTPLSHRNMIINGAMNIHQRGTTADANNEYGADRWQLKVDGVSNYTFVRSTTNAPTTQGFSNSLLYTQSTADSSVGVGDFIRIRYVIEAQDLLPLQAGSASAKPFTLSFWVRSSLTGTWAGNISASDGGKNIGFTYTISSANTWEKKEITLAGNTSDTPTYDNTAGYYIWLYLGSGSNFTGTSNTTWATQTDARGAYGQSNSLTTTSGATWQITGIQFELGSNATPFEHRSYGDELRRCQRYYEESASDGGSVPYATGTMSKSNQGTVFTNAFFNEPKRATPTVTVYSQNGVSGEGKFDNWGVGNTGIIDSYVASWITKRKTSFYNTNSTTTHQPWNLVFLNWKATAEL